MQGKIRGVTWYRKVIDKVFNPIITSVGQCAKCGARNAQFHCSHVFPKGEYRSLQYNPVNVLCICSSCHLWWWHRNPLGATEWFQTKFPARYIYLMEARKQIVTMNVEVYKKILELATNGDMMGLMKFPIDNTLSIH